MNPLYIVVDDNENQKTKVRAIINVLNIITAEMYQGRVAQIQLDIGETSTKIELDGEMLMVAIAELDMQRETDKTEAELAIAELAETVLGGV